MNNTDKSVLEFTTRLAYNVEGLSGGLKLYFSQFLTFHFSKTLSLNQIQHIENQKASQVLASREQVLNAAASISKEGLIWTIAAIQLLQAQAEKVDDRIVSRRISVLIGELISAFNFSNEEGAIEEQRKRIEQEIRQFQHRPVARIRAKIWPLTLDYGIRWAFLLIISYLGADKDLLTGYNLFLIPIFILILVYTIGRLQKKANRKMLDSYGGEHLYKIEYSLSATQYTWLAFLLGTGVFISYLLPDQLHLLAFAGLALYYFTYVRFLRLGKIEENDLIKQLETKSIITQSLNADENDEAIVELETNLNSSTSRLEAYVLESALFGALSFSGFLQIMATDLISFPDLERFASNIFIASQSFINFDWQNLNIARTALSDKVSLFCLVSVESLICSIFFLAVIASRLQFSDIADKVRTAINLAKAFNTKEEVLHDVQEPTEKKILRLQSLTAKVNEQLHAAAETLKEVNPAMAYMQYFRNAGILAFLVLLISSSLFITSALGWTFLVLALGTYLYFNRTIISERLKALFLNLRIQFIKKGYWLFFIALVPQLLAYVLKIFLHVPGTELLFPLSYLLVGLYIFAWLILAAHVDEQFGEIEMNSLRQSRWRFVKNSIAILILILAVALAFKRAHLTGANEMMLVSLTLLTILMFFVGYYLTKIRWIGIICGGLIGLVSSAVLFKVLHWTGANYLRNAANFTFLVFIPIIIWKRNLFHQLLVRFCLACSFISLWYSPLIYIAPMSMDIAYEHETVNIADLLNIMKVNDDDLFVEKGGPALAKGIAATDDYIDRYSNRFGFTLIHRHLVVVYHSYVKFVLTPDPVTHKIDSTLLPLALLAAREENKIVKVFDPEIWPDYAELGSEARVLVAMGKKEEAIRSLENIMAANPSGSIKADVRAQLDQLKNQSPP